MMSVWGGWCHEPSRSSFTKEQHIPACQPRKACCPLMRLNQLCFHQKYSLLHPLSLSLSLSRATLGFVTYRDVSQKKCQAGKYSLGGLHSRLCCNGLYTISCSQQMEWESISILKSFCVFNCIGGKVYTFDLGMAT